jgi:lipopolysaccharide/colanic/teichoic acid biosynthesis glycosyltransferase
LVEELDGIHAYSIVTGPDRLVGLGVKRAFDMVTALVGLILFSSVMAVVALAIRSRDGRPIPFTQERVGLHGRPLRLVKFRTIVPDAEARYSEVAALSDTKGSAFKMADDPRVTSLGRFLRRASLEELPRLWNVLKG